MTEAEFRAFVKETVVERCGWIVVADFSDRRRMPSGLTGVPDLLFGVPAHDGRSTPILIWFEAKSPTGKRTESQMEWFEMNRPLFCYSNRYIVASSWLEFYIAVEDLLSKEALTWNH